MKEYFSKDGRALNRNQGKYKGALKVLGILFVVSGAALSLVGAVSFFGSMGSFGMPKYFWCLFLGFPLLGIGIACLKFAYLGEVARYLTAETAPVGKDAANYMLDGTRDALGKTAGAIGEGLGLKGAGTEEAEVGCGSCGAANDMDAKFCSSCGVAMPGPKVCGCGEVNDADARFCDNCGQALG